MDKALLVGINKYSSNDLDNLHGCVNDITDMANFLNQKCQLAMGNIRLLADSRATTQAIRERLNWLTDGAKAGDRLFFHYSGHGAQKASRNPKAEVDGLDEVICPTDFDWTDDRMIRDKEFHSLFSKIPASVDFVWVSDSCHSGDLLGSIKMPKGKTNNKVKTVLPPADLDWRLRTATQSKIKALTVNGSVKALNLALISGCKSNQLSTDAKIKGRFNSVLTYYLLNELKKADGLTSDLKAIVKNVSAAIRKAKYSQEPQLEGSPTIMARPFLKSN
jgi:metacaspase-1